MNGYSPFNPSSKSILDPDSDAPPMVNETLETPPFSAIVDSLATICTVGAESSLTKIIPLVPSVAFSDFAVVLSKLK